jgi:hypothetical protein
MLVDETEFTRYRYGKTASNTALVSLAIDGLTTATALRTAMDGTSVIIDTVFLVGIGASRVHAVICYTFVAVAILCNVGLRNGFKTSCA